MLRTRIRYYLLDWKNANINQFMKMYGAKSLEDLTPEETLELFEKVTKYDKNHIKNLKTVKQC